MQFIALGNAGPYPNAEGACSSYLVKTKESILLFDCGTATLARLVKVIDPCTLDAIFISHWHADHCSDLFALSYLYQFQLPQGKKIKLYTIASPSSMLYQEACRNPYFDMENIVENQVLQIKDAQITCGKAIHPAPTLMFALQAEGKKWVYSADTNYFEGIVEFCKNADVLICDACFLHKQWAENKPHLSAKLAGQIAREATVGHLYCTHISPMGNAQLIFYEAFAEYPKSSVIETEKCYTL